MDLRELKSYLCFLVNKNGPDSVTELEYEFMSGKINFNTYLNRCYAYYSNGNFSKNKKG